jgi:phage tail-like protein
MPQPRDFDHIGAFHFQVEIEGVTQGAFISVSGLEATTDVVEFRNGNGIHTHARPGRTRYHNITLRRGYTANNELFDWYVTTTNGHGARHAGAIILLDDASNEIQRFNFFEAWPCRWRSYELDADNPGVLIEEIEIVVERFERG